MNIIEHLLTCLTEECAEVAKEACKGLRFGIDDRNVLDPTGPTNRERMIVELNQLVAVCELLHQWDVLPMKWRDESIIATKKAKVMEFMKYAEKVGALQPGKERPRA